MYIDSLLLSLLPPSYMKVPNRELVNTYFLLNLSILSNLAIYNNINIDIEIDIPRGRSTISSTNNSRELSVYLNISSILYIERMET